MKVVIVGGVAGGATAAARIRRLDEQAEIVVFERSGYISYANCGLPYYIGDVITDREDLTLQTPESFFGRFRVIMKVRHEVTAIHPDRKTVSVMNLETGEEFEENYDKLILAPGAKPAQPRLPGVGIDKLFTLRTVEDTFRIKDYINENHPGSVVLAGGGFIGLELAENLRELGMDVTIVQRPKQLMNPFDADMASFIHNEMRRHGVRLSLGHTVEGFEEKNDGVDVLLKGEAALHADMVVLAIGVTPDTALAKEAGLELGIKGSIVVNDRMETSIPDIYAAGDAVQVKHYVTGEDALISLAGPANKQGRIIADNICGRDSRYLGSQGSSVIKVFELTAASTGINETNARKAGLDVDTVILSPMSHAGYYPGGKVMTMKVVFEKETCRLLGAQIVGYEGVDKRIDVLATAIHAGLKADRLKDLDLAYAPPYSSAKDAVNMAGFMIDNIVRGTLKQWHLEDIDSLPRDGSVTLLDVRTVGEYEKSHIDGFRNIPVDELRKRLDEIEKNKRVYVICQSGLRSYIASRILEGNGFDSYNFSGGFRFYDAVINDRCLIEKAAACGMDGGVRDENRKYIQIRHWDYWWSVYGITKQENLSGAEFSITDDTDGEKLFFHIDLYALAGLEKPEEFMEPDAPEYPFFLEQANRLRHGEIDYFIGGLYYRDYVPSLNQCNRFLQTGKPVFDVKTPQQPPYYAVVFLRETAPLMPPLLIHWMEKLSVPLFRRAIQFEFADIPSKADARSAFDCNT